MDNKVIELVIELGNIALRSEYCSDYHPARKTFSWMHSHRELLIGATDEKSLALGVAVRATLNIQL